MKKRFSIASIKPCTACALSFLLVALSPGLAGYQAAAQTIPVRGGVPVAPGFAGQAGADILSRGSSPARIQGAAMDLRLNVANPLPGVRDVRVEETADAPLPAAAGLREAVVPLAQPAAPPMTEVSRTIGAVSGEVASVLERTGPIASSSGETARGGGVELNSLLTSALERKADDWALAPAAVDEGDSDFHRNLSAPDSSFSRESEFVTKIYDALELIFAVPRGGLRGLATSPAKKSSLRERARDGVALFHKYVIEEGAGNHVDWQAMFIERLTEARRINPTEAAFREQMTLREMPDLYAREDLIAQANRIIRQLKTLPVPKDPLDAPVVSVAAPRIVVTSVTADFTDAFVIKFRKGTRMETVRYVLGEYGLPLKDPPDYYTDYGKGYFVRIGMKDAEAAPKAEALAQYYAVEAVQVNRQTAQLVMKVAVVKTQDVAKGSNKKAVENLAGSVLGRSVHGGHSRSIKTLAAAAILALAGLLLHPSAALAAVHPALSAGAGGIAGAVLGFAAGAAIGWFTHKPSGSSGNWNFDYLFRYARAAIFGLAGAVIFAILGSVVGSLLFAVAM